MRRPYTTSTLLCLCGSLCLTDAARAAEASPPTSKAAARSSNGAPSKPAAPAPPVPTKPDTATANGSEGPAAEPAPDSEPAAPSPEVLREAKQRFDRGFELYGEGEYSLALIEFTRAYELIPNYRVLYNIGQVCIQLGQYANARRALQEYRDKGGQELSAERRAEVQRDLTMLEQRTAFLTITSNVEGAEVTVDDVVVGKSPLGPALLVDAGIHRIALRKRGYLQRTTRVTLAGGDEQAIEITLEAQPEIKPTIVVQSGPVEDDSNTLLIAGWIGTGALAAGAVVTGIMGANKASELEELRSADSLDHDDLGGLLKDTQSSAKSLLLASDVLSGAALVVGGLSLWLTLDPPEEAEPADEGPPSPPAAGGLQVGYEAGQVQLRGTF